MPTAASYRAVLRRRDVRRVLGLGIVIRVPLWAAGVVLTLHVVTHLGYSYGAAGLLDGVATVALALSGPWRGRRLDRLGLRRAIAPSLFVVGGCWLFAPFLGYWPLFVLAAIAGLFTVPSFSIVRQVVMYAVPEEHRTTALSIDAVAVEISYMIGPVLGVLLATYASTTWALFGCELAVVVGGALLWLANPTLRDERPDPAASAPPPPSGISPGPARRGAPRRIWPIWATRAVLGVCLAGAASTLVLTATDVSVVAALRHIHHTPWIGWVLAVWGLGSALGGVVYGALSRQLSPALMLALLSAATVPVALTDQPAVFAALLFVAGLFCAPTMTSCVDALSRLVPESVRGEALGWQGALTMAGAGLGAPLAGFAVDAAGWRGGFVLPALLSLAVAIVLVVLMRPRRAAEPAARSRPAPSVISSAVSIAEDPEAMAGAVGVAGHVGIAGRSDPSAGGVAGSPRH